MGITVHHNLPMTATVPSYQSRSEPDDLERIFNHLVQWVLTDTRSESSTLRIAIHPAYQQIIGLGQPAVPFLLREVERRSGRWFWALKAITRQDPVQPNDRGKTPKMIEAWLSWGQQEGYQW
ncbi:MAG: hypothetical protein ACRDEA_04335 [Microcystaceae cyanobacterium]